MDKLTLYREHIKKIMDEYAGYMEGQVELEKIYDEKNDHYQLHTLGWKNSHSMYGSPLHIDIRNGKIWIQHDGTEEGVANRFVEWGVPKEDIVLAFHEPSMRKFTEFAVG